MLNGETTRDPGVATAPMPGVISTESALLTAPQLSVAEPPAEMLEGKAVKDEIEGVPVQPVGGGRGDGGVIVRVGVGVGVTVVSSRGGATIGGIRMRVAVDVGVIVVLLTGETAPRGVSVRVGVGVGVI